MCEYVLKEEGETEAMRYVLRFEYMIVAEFEHFVRVQQ